MHPAVVLAERSLVARPLRMLPAELVVVHQMRLAVLQPVRLRMPLAELWVVALRMRPAGVWVVGLRMHPAELADRSIAAARLLRMHPAEQWLLVAVLLQMRSTSMHYSAPVAHRTRSYFVVHLRTPPLAAVEMDLPVVDLMLAGRLEKHRFEMRSVVVDFRTNLWASHHHQKYL